MAERPEESRWGDVAAVVLAAGKSTRMRSKTPKALHPVCGRPLLLHILESLGAAGVVRRVVVVGHQAEALQSALDSHYGPGVIEYALQAEQKGTGHAARMTEPLFDGYTGTVLVLPGDAPLLSAEVLESLIAYHREQNAAATVLTAVLPDAGAYGRILRDDSGAVTGIVEARDCTPEQREIREINTGVYAFSAPALFAALRDLRPDNAQGELYLTDVLGLLRRAGQSVRGLASPDPDVILGVNNRVELAEISEKLRRRLLRDLMLSGVSVADPATTYVEAGVEVGQDTVLLPGTHLTGKTRIGADCVIGPNAQIVDSTLGDGVQVRFSVVDRSEVGDGCKVGPYAHLRPGTRLGKSVKIGNFVETKAASIGDNVSAGHLTYLGDAEVGAGANIGAGTITCNYDGYEKHRTVIGANSFIGSQSTLVAPLVVGDNAFTAAGSVITDDVPTDALAFGRARQTVKEGWMPRYRARKGAEKAARLEREKETKQP
jgi:bifunctional UDP-N-acetylglucosamine pyrophosphorylase / glucosamine-1-phosphate N-acetyltransferase